MKIMMKREFFSVVAVLALCMSFMGIFNPLLAMMPREGRLLFEENVWNRDRRKVQEWEELRIKFKERLADTVQFRGIVKSYFMKDPGKLGFNKLSRDKMALSTYLNVFGKLESTKKKLLKNAASRASGLGGIFHQLAQMQEESRFTSVHKVDDLYEKSFELSNKFIDLFESKYGNLKPKLAEESSYKLPLSAKEKKEQEMVDKRDRASGGKARKFERKLQELRKQNARHVLDGILIEFSGQYDGLPGQYIAMGSDEELNLDDPEGLLKKLYNAPILYTVFKNAQKFVARYKFFIMAQREEQEKGEEDEEERFRRELERGGEEREQFYY